MTYLKKTKLINRSVTNIYCVYESYAIKAYLVTYCLKNVKRLKYKTIIVNYKRSHIYDDNFIITLILTNSLFTNIFYHICFL